MRLLLIQHAYTAAIVESLALVQRDDKIVEKCKCACGEVATSKRILSYNGYACGPPSSGGRRCRLEMPQDAQWTVAFAARAAQSISSCEIIELRLPSHAGLRWSEPLDRFWGLNNTAVRSSQRGWDWEMVALRVHPSLERLAAPPEEGLSRDLRARLDQMYTPAAAALPPSSPSSSCPARCGRARAESRPSGACVCRPSG